MDFREKYLRSHHIYFRQPEYHTTMEAKTIKKTIKWALCSLTIIAVLLVGGYLALVSIPYKSKDPRMSYYSTITENPSHRNKAALRDYCLQNGLNTNVCILVNYGIRSGLPRFFIYDFNRNKITYRCRCAHGLGGGSTARTPVFSNSNGSKCSSLGKFVISGIGSAHYRNCIRLRGLDPTNSNAEQRGILIHAAGIVTRFRLLPWIPLNRSCEGCFTITKGGLMKIHDILNQETNQNILVYAYN